MSFRFLHLADLHLETRFGGREDTRERLRQATHEAFERAVDHAIENRLDALLAAGDLFDDPILSVRTELFFAGELKRLAQAGVWFLAACGNHDPGGAGFRTADLGVEGERVRFFREPEPQSAARDEPRGRGRRRGGRRRASLANTSPRTSPRPFHASLARCPWSGCCTRTSRARRAAADHARYAPSTRADYERLAYAYWALGHIHLRQQAVPGLPVHYAGNLQGRHIGETGEKGGLVVEAFAGASAEPRFVRFASVRWERVSGARAVLDRIDRRARRRARAPDRRAAARARRSAGAAARARGRDAARAPPARRRRAHAARRGAASSAPACSRSSCDADGVSLPIDRARLRESPSVLAEALALIERARSDDALLAELAPVELARAPDGDEPRLAYLRELLDGLPEELILRGVEPEGV